MKRSSRRPLFGLLLDLLYDDMQTDMRHRDIQAFGNAGMYVRRFPKDHIGYAFSLYETFYRRKGILRAYGVYNAAPLGAVAKEVVQHLRRLFGVKDTVVLLNMQYMQFSADMQADLVSFIYKPLTVRLRGYAYQNLVQFIAS